MAYAQSGAATTKIQDCYQVVSGDSVSLYYNRDYQLMPVACGSIRRQSRINAKGNFNGAVADYRAGDNRLLLRGHYQDNQRAGAFEQYDEETGKLVWSGAYTHGQPSGEWRYWYPSGLPRQVVRYEPMGLRLWQYWDEQGQQRLTDGKGEWRDKDNYGGWRGGPVEKGLPTGRWESHGGRAFGKDAPLLTAETFEAGKLVKGQVAFGLPGGSNVYRDASRILPLAPRTAYQAAESFDLGGTCEEQRNREARAARSLPQWPGGIADFEKLVIGAVNRRLAYWPAEVDQVILTAAINEKGGLSNVQAEPAAARNAAEWLLELPRKWTPAQQNGRPVSSHVRVQVTRHTNQTFLVKTAVGWTEPSISPTAH